MAPPTPAHPPRAPTPPPPPCTALRPTPTSTCSPPRHRVVPFRPAHTQGCKIEGITDLTNDVSIYATDDESRGAFLSVFHRHTGLSWRVDVALPEGANPQHYGISGIAPLDPSVTSLLSDSEPEEPARRDDGEEEEGGLF